VFWQQLFFRLSSLLQSCWVQSLKVSYWALLMFVCSRPFQIMIYYELIGCVKYQLKNESLNRLFQNPFASLFWFMPERQTNHCWRLTFPSARSLGATVLVAIWVTVPLTVSIVLVLVLSCSLLLVLLGHTTLLSYMSHPWKMEFMNHLLRFEPFWSIYVVAWIRHLQECW